MIQGLSKKLSSLKPETVVWTIVIIGVICAVCWLAYPSYDESRQLKELIGSDDYETFDANLNIYICDKHQTDYGYYIEMYINGNVAYAEVPLSKWIFYEKDKTYSGQKVTVILPR